MSCSTVTAASPLKVVEGATLVFNLRFNTKENDVVEPFDLTGATCAVKFMKTDGTILSKSIGSGVTVVSAALGKVSVTLSTSDTALLTQAELQTIEAVLVKAGITYKVLFLKALTVIEETFD